MGVTVCACVRARARAGLLFDVGTGLNPHSRLSLRPRTLLATAYKPKGDEEFEFTESFSGDFFGQVQGGLIFEDPANFYTHTLT